MSGAGRSPASVGGVARFVATRPVAVAMMTAAVCVFGWVSLQRLPVTLLPELSYPTLTVRTEHPGAAPSEVEELVTRPLEENLAVVAGLSSYRSVSRAGTSDVVLEFEWDTPMTFAAQDVREKVDQLLPRLPRGVERPLLLRYDPAFDPVLRLGFYGAADLYRLRDYGENEIKRRLETIPGVAAVKIKGGYEKEIRVELKERLLRAEKVSPELVNQRLQAENVNVPGGVLRDGDVEYLVRTLNEFRSPEEIGELVVTQQGGRAVRLKDLGEVRVGHKERDVVTRIDGAESVEIEIYKEADANLTAVAQAVKERLFGADWRRTLVDGDYAPPPATPPAPTADGRPGDKSERKPLAALLPSGMRLKVLSDQSTFIEGSLREVNEGAFQGALLATLVLFAFLRRLKPTLIIAVAIPVSIVATFAPLYLAGVSLNIMSLGGLALGVGMLVDNSIVVLEAVTRRREAGEGVFAAAVNGAREMSAAVFGSTLTTVVVFLPIVFVEGSAGQIFRDQALAVVFSLLASLAAALVLVPMLAALDVPTGAADVGRRRRALAALRRYGRPTRWPSVRGFRRDRGLRRWALLPWRLAQVPFDAASRLLFFAAALPAAGVAWVVAKFGRALGFVLRPPLRLFDLGFSFVQRAVAATLAGALRARLLTLAIVGVLGAAAAIAYGGLRQDLLPAVRQGLFYVEIQFDVGTPVERTDARALALESVARDALARAGVVPASVSLVSGTPRDAQAKPGDGSHTTRLWFRLRIGDGRVAEVEDRARAAVLAAFEAVPGVGAPVVDAPQLFRASQPLEVEITGADPARLREAAEILERETARLPGVTGVRSTVRRGRPEIVVRPDREALARYDLKLGDVAAVVRAKVQGEVATRFSENDRRIEVRTRLPEDETASAAAVSQLQVNPGRTPPIPLSAVATVETSAGPAEIRHVGGRRAEIVAADLAGLDLRGAADALAAIVRRAEAARPDVFRTTTARVAGQNAESEASRRALGFALALAVFLVYLVMAAQFESLSHPLVILFTIPLALIGVVFALRLTDIAVSVLAFIGVILLAGVVVNNAIILIDTVNRLRREGMRRDDALKEASQMRLRPIAMTTATTLLGLVPLALGFGEGAEMRRPMAVVVIAGLAASTVLTLVVIPTVYSLAARPGPLRSQFADEIAAEADAAEAAAARAP